MKCGSIQKQLVSCVARCSHKTPVTDFSKIHYLGTDFFPTKEPNCQSQQPHHCPLHQEAELHRMDTEMIEVVSYSLPDTGHTVSSHKKEGKDRVKGGEIKVIQLPLPELQTTRYFLVSMKKNRHTEMTKPSNFLFTSLLAKQSGRRILPPDFMFYKSQDIKQQFMGK